MVPSKISILPTNSPTNLPTDSLCQEVRETAVVQTTHYETQYRMVGMLCTKIFSGEISIADPYIDGKLI